MLSFDVSLSGTQVGAALADDGEELAYALVELADDHSMFEEISENIGWDDRTIVINWLRALANHLAGNTDNDE